MTFWWKHVARPVFYTPSCHEDYSVKTRRSLFQTPVFWRLLLLPSQTGMGEKRREGREREEWRKGLHRFSNTPVIAIIHHRICAALDPRQRNREE